jgi:hypothetical protein
MLSERFLALSTRRSQGRTAGLHPPSLAVHKPTLVNFIKSFDRRPADPTFDLDVSSGIANVEWQKTSGGGWDSDEEEDVPGVRELAGKISPPRTVSSGVRSPPSATLVPEPAEAASAPGKIVRPSERASTRTRQRVHSNQRKGNDQ